MTGWAQVNGLRGDTSISDRLQHDLYYIRNWSFGLDLQILARTMFTALKDENGY
jgi:lipopolysaccharide/colanic/teichoic acid biosynthesis glycosyltransferase